MPGAGIDAQGRVVTVKSANYLVPHNVLQELFRARFRDALAGLAKDHDLPPVDPAVWQKDWGVHLQPFGSGENIIRYLGRYVARTAIGDSRILAITDTHVTFRWKDRANASQKKPKRSPASSLSADTCATSCRAACAQSATSVFAIPPPNSSASASPSTPAGPC